MEMLLYLVIAAVLYGIVADRTDRAVEREIRKRRQQSADLHLVEDLDAGPDLRPRDHWFLRHVRALRHRVRASPASRRERAREMTRDHNQTGGRQ